MVPKAPAPNLYRKEPSLPPCCSNAWDKLSVVSCFLTNYLVTKVSFISNCQLDQNNLFGLF